MSVFKANFFELHVLDNSCALIYTPPGQRCQIVFPFIGEDLYALRECVARISPDVERSDVGSWSIVKDSLYGIFSLEFRGTRLYIGLDEMIELLHLMKTVKFLN